MKKFITIILLSTIFTSFGMYYIYQNYIKKDTFIYPEDIKLIEYQSLKFSDYVEIDSNKKITSFKTDKLKNIKSKTIENLYIPGDWKNSEINGYTFITNENEYLYFGKIFFYQEGELKKINPLKNQNKNLEDIVGPDYKNKTLEEQKNIQNSIYDVLKSTDEATGFFSYQEVEKLINTDISNINNYVISYPEDKTRQNIQGNFTLSKSFEGNGKTLYEFYNIQDDTYIWTILTENEVFYIYGYLNKEDTKDLFRIIFLNLK